MRDATFSPEDGIIGIAEFLHKISEVEFPLVKNNKKISYYNVPAAFDIEVSSFYINEEKYATMYVWQFGILNWVTAGRTWDEFEVFMSVLSTILELDENKRLIIYIQNMGYEFQFMRKRIKWDKLFFLDDRKPVYGITGGFEYRCSWKLSSKSLANIGKDLQKYPTKKMIGDLDYTKIRHSSTPLTSLEWGYCEADIRVLLAYIQEKIESDGDITQIPLTNTGYVRNYCRKECFRKYKQYHNLMSELTLDPDEYSQLKRAFAGGFTHASARYSGKVLLNVGSFDFTSSYPAVMLSEKFPMGKAKLVSSLNSTEEFEYYLDHYCCLVDITFKNLVPKVNYDRPLSESKLFRSSGVVTDNGRVVCATLATTTITEQDYWVLNEFYSWDDIEIHEMRIYDKAYLPKAFVVAILELYKRKTSLKGIDGEEINYMISKNMINASYGMTVTDIVREVVEYVDDTYITAKPDVKEVIDKYNKSIKRFLFYPWGVWVTSYARANLFSGILACGNDYIYSDTDSIKILHPERHMKYIEAYNKEVMEKLDKVAKFHGIDLSEFSPLNKKGVPKPIGVWDFEGVYDRFKTLGAKRYMVKKPDSIIKKLDRSEFKSLGETCHISGKCSLSRSTRVIRYKAKKINDYVLTVAGVNKQKAMKYIIRTFEDPMDGLQDNLIIPKEYSGRITSTYVDEPAHGVVTDYLGNTSEFSELSYIHMEPSDYNLTISEDYDKFLKFLHGLKEESW